MVDEWPVYGNNVLYACKEQSVNYAHLVVQWNKIMVPMYVHGYSHTHMQTDIFYL